MLWLVLVTVGPKHVEIRRYMNKIEIVTSFGSSFRMLNLRFVVPCVFNHSNKTPNKMQQLILKFYCFVVQTLLNMFRALQCPSSRAHETAFAASGFHMNVEVEVFSAVVGLLDHG
jgi:hypothetical protein